MKKTLFLLLITGVLGSLQAQNSTVVKPNCITVSPVQLAQARMKASQARETALAAKAAKTPSKKNHSLGSSEPTLPFLGSSANVNGVLDATTSAVTANQACDLIVMTHRDNWGDEATCGTGAYIAATSTDNGSVWDTTVTLFCNSASAAGVRYPNGSLFNPGQGGSSPNTNPANIYDVMSGPYTDGTNWVQNVFGSIQLSGTAGSNAYGMYWANDTAGVQTENTGDLSFMSSSDDSTVHVIGEGYTYNTAGTEIISWLGAVLTTGKFDAVADSFKWKQTLFRPHIVPDYVGFGNSMSNYDSDAAPLSVPGTAWSQDGKTGYVVFFANLDSSGVGYDYNFYTDQPIIYKTTNSGQTWAMMPPFNFRNLPSLTTHLEATTDSTSIKIPIWFTFEGGGAPASQGAVDNYDLTVDYNGNLHILGVVVSSYYCNPDSSYTIHYYSNEDGYIYDVSTNGATWQARYIDSMKTLPLWNAGVYNVSGDWDSTGTAAFAGFGNRLQISRTTDAKHIFYTWSDDTTGFIPNYIGFPDVFGQGYDVATNTAGRTYQFTHTTNNYYLCVSDIVLTTVSGPDTTYTVPCTIAYPEQLPDDGTQAINYYYLGSVVYTNSLTNPSSITPVTDKGFSISPNFPNPFSNTTQFNISMSTENVVSVDVFNLFGQKVYSMPSQQMSAGTRLMTINGTGWSAGVYFYRVTVGDKSVTQKMVVQ